MNHGNVDGNMTPQTKKEEGVNAVVHTKSDFLPSIEFIE